MADSEAGKNVHAAHEAFLRGDGALREVRGLVVDSWLRSAAAGIDTDATVAPLILDRPDLVEYRDAHPLSTVFPLLYDVLGSAAQACDSIMAVGDAHGQLLWVCGQPGTLSQAERINFVEGSAWSETLAGTNAPGTALRLDGAVQIRGAEHFSRAVQRWSCAAAPIHDPKTQAIIGVVDVTGGPEVNSPQTLAMVRAAARMAEAELGRLAAVARVVRVGQQPHQTADALLIDGLGRPDCQVYTGTRSMRLSPRHSEILAILAEFPDGLSGDQLAIELYRGEVTSSTLRAEMTRLRALLGTDTLDSRPYRLRVPAECDWLTVEAHLAAGRVADAVRAYRGPLLPQSDAPGVARRRERLEQQLRAAIMASGQVDLMNAWTRTRWGADDLSMWERQVRVLPANSPLRPLAAAEIRRLRQEFGIPAQTRGRRG